MPEGDRQTYAPSGRFDIVTLLVDGLFGVGIAALLASGLVWVTLVDGYAVGWLTLVLVLVLNYLTGWTVRDAKCRNPLLAALAAGALGVLLLLAHFHIDQCQRWGVAWERLDRLPGYVAFRMETDGWWHPDLRFPCRWAAPANPAAIPWAAAVPSADTKWLVLLAELLAVGVIPAVVAWRAASRPFDETVGEWCVRDRVDVTPQSAHLLQEALASGDVAEWARAGFERSVVGGEHVAVEVWYTPRRPGQDAVAAGVYVGVGGRRPARLTPEEAAALTVLLPEIGTLAVAPEELEDASAGRVVEPDVAHLSRISGERVGWAKNAGVKYLGRAAAIGVSVSPLLGLFALGGVMYLIHLLGADSLPAVIAFGVVSLVLLVFTQNYWLHPDNDLTWRFLVWYYRGVIRREARGRPDALFAVDDAAVVYAEMIPRRAWSALSEMADVCEGGLVLVDEAGGRLLFEGDRYRYEIPFAAIEAIELEELRTPSSTEQWGTTAGFYAVVVTVRARRGSREFPLCPFANVPGRNRWEKAGAFHEWLKSAVGAARPDAVA